MPTTKRRRLRPRLPNDNPDIEELLAIDRHPWPPVELTADQRERVERHHESQPNWHPQFALRYGWPRADRVHGRGGAFYLGQPCKPGDPGWGDGWRLQRFLECLETDRGEIDRVAETHPRHRNRLETWVRDMSDLGREIDRDADHRSIGDIYRRLSRLGYSGRHHREEE